MKPSASCRASATTDILIGVPLLAMLAAAAVPRYKEAGILADVATVRSDMRDVAAALEVYHSEWGTYPYDGYNASNFPKYNYWYLPIDLSTPVAYLDSASITDPFRDWDGSIGHWQFGDIRYRNIHSTFGMEWLDEQSTPRSEPSIWLNAMLQDVGAWDLRSVGPDGYWGPSTTSGSGLFPGGAHSWPTPSGYGDHTQPYDPTNGADSWGDILHTQANPWGYANMPSEETNVPGWEQLR